MDEIKVAFLTVDETLSQGGYIGAILITNNEGFPLEFRCTYPLKPTAIQKILYGNSIKKHIGINLCGETLFEQIENRPVLIISDKNYLVGLREKIQCPVIFLRSGEDAEKGEILLELPVIDTSDKQGQPQKKFFISTVSRFNEEIQQNLDKIKNIFSFINPLEPFDRINKALVEIKSKDDKFR